VSAPQEPHVAIYLRVSTDKQDLARQEEGTRQLAGAKFPNLPVYEYREQGVSASKHLISTRPEGSKLVETIKTGNVAAVIADQQSRFERGGGYAWQLFVYECHQQGAEVWTVTGGKQEDTAQDELIGSVKAFIDRIESEEKGHRTRTKREWIAAQGGWSGGPAPLGYETTPHESGRFKVLRPTSDASAVVEAFEQYATGAPLNRVSDALSETVGKHYDRHATRKLLRNSVYVGRLPRRNEADDLPGLHPALVNVELFDRVQERLDRVAVERSAHHPRIQPFGALARCGNCDSVLSFHWPRVHWTYYRCAACKQRKTIAAYFEEAVVLALVAIERELVECLDDPTWAVLQDPDEKVAEAQRKLDQVNEKAEYTLGLILDDTIGRKQGEKQLEALKRERHVYEAEIRRYANNGDRLRADLEELRDQLLAFPTSHQSPTEAAADRYFAELYGLELERDAAWLLSWREHDFDSRREFLDSILTRVELEPGRAIIHTKAALPPISVPLVPGRRDREYVPLLEEIGLGRPEASHPPQLRAVGPEEPSASSSHAATRGRPPGTRRRRSRP
jgi:DNA invertase Pin-like site-specific DNA recombinase